MKILLPSVYFGNIEYFSKIFQANEILVEHSENFIKQTYRNRCEIYGANGKLDLIIPIKKGKSQRTQMKNALIDNSSRWQTLHWRSIESGYRRSPYFEYYEDKLQPLFEKKFDFLIEWNNETTQLSLSLLREKINFEITEEYHSNYEKTEDLRLKFDPKLSNDFKHEKYTQVFENKFGFFPNLSVLDVLFNLGPQGISLLKK